MNEEFKTKILEKSEEILSFIEKGVRETGDFASDQIPILIKEILAFGLFENLFFSILITLTMCILIYFGLFFKYSFKVEGDGDEENVVKISLLNLAFRTEEPYFLLVILVNIPSIVSIIMFFDVAVPCFINAAKIIIAPRLYILEYITELAKNIT